MKFKEIEVGQDYEVAYGHARVVEKDPQRVEQVFSGARWELRGHRGKPAPMVRVIAFYSDEPTPEHLASEGRWIRPQQVKGLYDPAAEREAKQRAADAETAREDREAVLRRRCGEVEDLYAVRFRYVLPRGGPSHWDTSTVEVKTAVLERLLDELELYREVGVRCDAS